MSRTIPQSPPSLTLLSSVCIASIVRIITIHHLIHSLDLTWAMAGVFIWSCCEPFIGIVCACIPTYAPLFRRWWAAARGTTSGNRSKPGISSNGKRGLQSSDVEAKAGSHITSSSHAGRVERSARDPFRVSKGKREWNRITGPNNHSDDEVQLTNDISGPGSKSARAAYPMNDIVVTKGISWNSSQMVDSDAE